MIKSDAYYQLEFPMNYITITCCLLDHQVELRLSNPDKDEFSQVGTLFGGSRSNHARHVFLFENDFWEPVRPSYMNEHLSICEFKAVLDPLLRSKKEMSPELFESILDSCDLSEVIRTKESVLNIQNKMNNLIVVDHKLYRRNSALAVFKDSFM